MQRLFILIFLFISLLGCAKLGGFIDTIFETEVHSGIIALMTYGTDYNIVCFEDGVCYEVEGSGEVGSGGAIQKTDDGYRLIVF